MRYAAIVALACSLCALAASGSRAQAATVSPSLYQGMHWRFVGPLRGGRTVAIDGIANQPNVFYIAAVNGGIWKTQDAGRTWVPIFDREGTGSIGALAVAPSNPNVVYAGSGEGLQRPDLSVGDGVYKSTDAGTTWTHLGLRDGQQIASMAVDPTNPDRLFVAVLGHPYAANPERGIYRSTDGGATFERVLFTNEDAGGFAVKIDPHDPKTVYATLWAARQAPWEIGASFEIAGSGVYKSSDGGTTWTQLTSGLPARIGRTEVAVAPSNSQVVYVYADAEANGEDAGALYRSDDAGAHFAKVNDADEIAERGDDLVSIAVDPRDPQTVYLTNTSTYRSTDGGRTLVAIKGAPGGDDYHTVWINPSDPGIVALASDQGATISVDGGATWSSWYNQPTAQMYHVNADDRFPYWLCGGQQESGSACVSSRGAWGQTTVRDWHPAGAQEYGYVVPDPLHPGVFYGGKVEKFDERTGQAQEVSPIALPTKQFRVVRTEPIVFDRFDRHRMYFGSNVVFVTEDGGHAWHVISPDLTRTQPAVPSVLGAFASDDPARGKHRGVVYALAPSWVHRGTLWAGTDDGQVWIARDASGSSVAHWKNITPPELTPWSKVAQIDASRTDDETAFVAVTRFRLDDQRPYVYVTHDGGAQWRLAVDGLPNEPVNAVRQDPVQPHLLYAATENGVYVSFDEGDHWQSLQLGLPHTSVRDVIVHGNDLAIATHGRGFWILDDITPLRQLSRDTANQAIIFFAPETAIRVDNDFFLGTPLPPEEPTAKNPPDGAIIDYVLNSAARNVSLEILDANNKMVRHVNSDQKTPTYPPLPIAERWLAKPSVLETSPGMHRYSWNLRWGGSGEGTDSDDDDGWGAPRPPRIAPGDYTLKLTVDGKTFTQPLKVAMDPRSPATPQILAQQQKLGLQMYGEAIQTRKVLTDMDVVTKKLAALKPQVQSSHPELISQITAIESAMKAIKSGTPGPPGTISGLTAASAALASALRGVEGGDRTTPSQVLEIYRLADEAAKSCLADWQKLQNGALAELSRSSQSQGLPAVTLR